MPPARTAIESATRLTIELAEDLRAGDASGPARRPIEDLLETLVERIRSEVAGTRTRHGAATAKVVAATADLEHLEWRRAQIDVEIRGAIACAADDFATTLTTHRDTVSTEVAVARRTLEIRGVEAAELDAYLQALVLLEHRARAELSMVVARAGAGRATAAAATTESLEKLRRSIDALRRDVMEAREYIERDVRAGDLVETQSHGRHSLR